MFKVGDWVQLNEKARTGWLKSWYTNPSYDVFSKPMKVFKVYSTGGGTWSYAFEYPTNHPNLTGSGTYHISGDDLELAKTLTEPECRCSVQVLMLAGCKCGNFK